MVTLIYDYFSHFNKHGHFDHGYPFTMLGDGHGKNLFPLMVTVRIAGKIERDGYGYGVALTLPVPCGCNLYSHKRVALFMFLLAQFIVDA
jgi:hypothetical protein